MRPRYATSDVLIRSEQCQARIMAGDDLRAATSALHLDRPLGETPPIPARNDVPIMAAVERYVIGKKETPVSGDATAQQPRPRRYTWPDVAYRRPACA